MMDKYLGLLFSIRKLSKTKLHGYNLFLTKLLIFFVEGNTIECHREINFGQSSPDGGAYLYVNSHGSEVPKWVIKAIDKWPHVKTRNQLLRDSWNHHIATLIMHLSLPPKQGNAAEVERLGNFFCAKNNSFRRNKEDLLGRYNTFGVQVIFQFHRLFKA